MSHKSRFHVIHMRPVEIEATLCWEYSCSQCTYRALYTPGIPANGSWTHLIDDGDPDAVHAGMPRRKRESLESAGISVEPGANPDPVDDLVMAWMAPASRKWLVSILSTLG